MPATQGLGGENNSVSTDQVPFGAVVAGDAHASAAGEDGVGVGIGTVVRGSGARA